MKLRLLIVLVIMVLQVSNNTAQTIHAIVFAATEDATIGQGTKLSFERINKEVERIANQTDMETILYYRTGKQFTTASLEKVYDRLKGYDLEEDVILFYFLGHGYKSRSKYPTLLFTNTRGDLTEEELEAVSINLDDVSKKLLKYKARLTLVIGEACNDDFERTGTGGNDVTTMSRPPVIDNKKYEKLFLYASGGLLLSSSKSGQPSYISATKGGAFTQGFLKALSNQTRKDGEDIQNVSWSQMIREARQNTQLIARENKFEVQQTPQFSVTKKLRYFIPPPAAKEGKRKRYGFFTWLVALVAPNKVEKSFNKALKGGDLLALETILDGKGEEGDKLKQKMLRQSPVTFYMAQAMIYEEKEDTLNALVNYKIAYQLGQENRSKRDQKLIDKIIKKNGKSKVIKGLSEAKNYQTWLKQKFFRFKSFYQDDMELADTEIVRIEGEIKDIEASIEADEQKISVIENELDDNGKKVKTIQDRIDALDIKRQQKIEVKLTRTQDSEATIKQLERYMDELRQSGAVDDVKDPVTIGDATVEFKFAKRKTASSLEPTSTGYEVGKYCTEDIQKTTNAIMGLLLRPVGDVPKNRRKDLAVKVKIVGNSDWIGASSGQPLSIWYESPEDVFEEYTNKDGDKKTFRLTKGERRRITNEELAFLRAYCANNIISDLLIYRGINNYEVQYQAIEHEIPVNIDPKDREAGRQYRGIDIDMTIENLYKHYVEEIEQLEDEIRKIRRETRNKRSEIATIEEGIEEKREAIEAKETEIQAEKDKKKRLRRILNVAKADREIQRVKELQGKQ